MAEKVSEKEKMQNKAIAYVEKLMAEGLNITRARDLAVVKFGVSGPTMVRWTRHLSKDKAEV